MSVLDLPGFKPNAIRRDTLLRRTMQAVVEFGPDTQKIIDDIVETMAAHRIAIGLAAPQVGIDLRIAAINISKKPGDVIVLCNPVVISISGKKDKKQESCMSIPGYGGIVERREKIGISYQDRGGHALTMSATGFLARVIQHEIDHLNGALYVDRMDPSQRLREVDLFEDD